MKNRHAKTGTALLKKIASALLAGMLLVMYAFPAAAIADMTQAPLRSATVQPDESGGLDEVLQTNQQSGQLVATNNVGTDLLEDQKFYLSAVKSIATMNPLEFAGYLFGFGFSKLFGAVFGPDGDGAGQTLAEVKKKVDKIMGKLDEVSAKQDQMMSQLSQLSTMVECAQLNNVMNSYEQLKNQNWAPSAIYNSVKLDEAEGVSDEERNERIMSDLLGGMGFGSDYTTYNRTDVAFDNYVYQLGQAVMGPYNVTFKDDASLSSQSGNIFWIYYQHQRRSVPWEHLADDDRAAFNNDVMCTYMLSAILDLESLGARYRAIQDYNANRKAGDPYVSDTPVLQMMKQLLEQMDDVSRIASEWIVYPNSDVLNHWVPGQEMRIAKSTAVRITTVETEHNKNRGTADELPIWAKEYDEELSSAYASSVFTALDRDQGTECLADSDEMNWLLNSYNVDKAAGRVPDGTSFWGYLKDVLGIAFPDGADTAAGAKAVLPVDRHVPRLAHRTNPSYPWNIRGFTFAAFTDSQACTTEDQLFDNGIVAGAFGQTNSYAYDPDKPRFYYYKDCLADQSDPSFLLVHVSKEAQHTLTRHEGFRATCSDEGREAYYTCSTCGKWFSDALGNNEIEKDNLDALAIPKADHWWSFEGFTWKAGGDNGIAGYTSATANYTCIRDKTHKITVPATLSSAKNGGKCVYKATVAAKDSPDKLAHAESKSVQISKKANTIRVSKATNLKTTFKTAAQTLSRPLTVTGAKGAVTYAKTGGKPYFSVNASTGKVTMKKSTPAGAYTVKITATAAGNGDYDSGSVTGTIKVTVSKAANTMKVSRVTKSLSAMALAKAKRTVKPLTVKAAKGRVSYALKSGSKRLYVNKDTGAITVKKGTKAGAYKAIVTVKAAGSPNYKAKSMGVRVTIRVM